MTEEFLNDCYQDLLEQLEENNAKVTAPLIRVRAALTLIKSSISRIKQELLNHTFASEAEQIRLNKYWMVKFYALFVYETERFRITDALPAGSAEVVRGYYEGQLEVLDLYLQAHAFWFGYYKNEQELFDAVLFLNHSADQLFLPESPEFFGFGLPVCTYIFARFRAYEQLREHLLVVLGTPSSFDSASVIKRKNRRELRWTGESINAVELGFGLHDTGQINNGNASLTEIFDWMSDTLNIVIKKPHRRFDEIEARKIISKTDFTDQLRNSILNRIDRKNEYDPEKEELRRQRAERKRKASEKRALEITTERATQKDVPGSSSLCNPEK
ncbi:RteC domain-containing protein [Pedobacter sp. V48]|uniref:RteC domain-containing protein n=1 Tax=Pedobacter sp. V48 TaxID=509635 RepID=UPI0003E4DD03|nr:RteC domain-containing protein [Pedobacter sp. V48]ETZ20150.1 hypothetical protein N824_08025 [Pedobacter sp. V48]